MQEGTLLDKIMECADHDWNKTEIEALEVVLMDVQTLIEAACTARDILPGGEVWNELRCALELLGAVPNP